MTSTEISPASEPSTDAGCACGVGGCGGVCSPAESAAAADASAYPEIPLHAYVDLVCPWCMIGKRRLDQAVERYRADGGRVEISYLPYQLDPQASRVATELIPALATKFGGPEQAAQAMTHVSDIAARDGIEMDFDAALTVNTLDAHRVLFEAGKQGERVQSALADRLLAAHLCNGEDLSDPAVLQAACDETGVDLEVAAYLASGQNADVVGQLQEEARAGGISSVPTYVFAGRWGVSGAQEPDTLHTLLHEVGKTMAGMQSEAGGGCCGGGCCG